MSTESPRVLVTGASGYIALHIVHLLLKEGYRVRGTVRDLHSQAKIKPLKDIFPHSRYPLELVEADLNKDDGWEEAVRDCSYVMHVASPCPDVHPETEDDLILPAVEGTKRVLRACAHSGTVKRVVLTSSNAAIHGPSVRVENNRVYNEEDWSDPDSPDLNTYGKSKTLAEKTAWEFVDQLEEGKKFELAVINPCITIGPSFSKNASSSVGVVLRLMNKSIPLIPPVSFSLCDVRDVALAHLRAMVTPEAAGQRHLVANVNIMMKEIACILHNEFAPQGYWISTLTAPYLIFWIASFFHRSLNFILPRCGNIVRYSNERLKNVLRIQPRNINETILDTAYSLLEHGNLSKM
ncbi:NADPH-dependent methylglyoxal reductase GRE2-like [Limulus polyphemus]|uniref:NADPH-dependent methylglyoxal reductase GRE2-like n=1 Tax=Limulus polyphemus TaxID=6850 RepID=A0ABM1BV60_LIMPO|nr:NADPH-dependent methylglyoxal reductase GRE2-like [Limulus polyphemus]